MRHARAKLDSEQPNYVKKVVFPREILSCVAVGNACFFHALTSWCILIVFELIAFKAVPLTLFWLPLSLATTDSWRPRLLLAFKCEQVYFYAMSANSSALASIC